MPSSYSTNLKIELQATGENSGTWGTITNTNLGTALEQAIVGYGNPSYASDANLTLTYTDTNAAQAARALVLNVTSAVSLTNTRELVVPTIQKQYIVQNNTTGSQSITVKTSGGTGITVPNGRKAHLYVNGTDVIYMDDYVDINGGAIDGTPIGANSASTGAFTTLSASGNITVSGGTANGVLYLNGSKVATSGSALTFDGTTLGVTSGGSTPALRVFGASTSQGQIQFGSVNGYLIQGGADYLGLNFNTNNATRYYISDTGVSVWSVGGSEQMRLTSTGLGIGTSSPSTKLHVVGSGNPTITLAGSDGAYTSIFSMVAAGGGSSKISATGGSNQLILATNSVDRVSLDSSGNLGLGVTPSAWGSGRKAIQIGGVANNYFMGSQNTVFGNNAFNDGTNWKYLTSYNAGLYVQNEGGQHQWYTAPSGTAGNAITFTQAMTLDASGNLGVGTASPSSIFEVKSATPIITLNGTTNASARGLNFQGNGTLFGSITANYSTGEMKIASGASGLSNYFLTFFTDNTERARITSGGTLMVGKTTDADAGAGVRLLADGLVQATRNAADPLSINRTSDDGVLVSLRQDGVLEGNISVSGNTVSYNSFAGSHWSQLQDGSKPDILRGTVMESINELCVWPGEQNERLPKAKISDTAGSKKVYGVFMAWDNDWTETNDMYVTAVGAFICRVNGSVTVQEGDLLESNGDGTARVQADDIIRSSTIGKVTSTVKTHEYDDGSYCVPTVLYCG